MFLKNKVVFFAFQDHFSYFQPPIFSLDWKKILSKIFGIFTTKIFDIFIWKNSLTKGELTYHVICLENLEYEVKTALVSKDTFQLG